MLATAWSQPKVAVLDAIIPQNMDPSVIVPVTEKIVERLVVSGRFTVLDRANIDSVLKEREFQMSGMVSDQDVVTAGKYLGADFVVVAKVQKVSDTYFVSAKMINIKTGVIANQTSAEGEGKLSALIDLASQVGEVLSGGAVTALSSTGEAKDISKPAATPATPAASATPASPPPAPKVKEKLKARVLASVGGGSGTITFSNGNNFNGVSGGIDLHMLVPLFGGFSLVGGFDSIDFTTTSGSNSSDNNYIDLMAGAGYALKLGAVVPFVDIKGGYTSGAESGSKTWSGSGGCLGFDAGAYFDIGKWFVLGLRYQYVGIAIDVENATGTIVETSSFFLSAGVRF